MLTSCIHTFKEMNVFVMDVFLSKTKANITCIQTHQFCGSLNFECFAQILKFEFDFG